MYELKSKVKQGKIPGKLTTKTAVQDLKATAKRVRHGRR